MNLFNILATRPSIITSQRICHSLEKNIWIFRVCLIIFALTTTSCSARVAETIITDDSNTRLVLYVDTSGNDKWSGLLPDVTDDGQDGPFATIGRAIVTIRKMKAQQGIPKAGIVVEFASGRYQLDKTLEFTLLDSGTTESPIIYRARPGADVRLSGSIPISDWLKVTDETIINRLDKQSRANVFMADLKKSACSNIKASIGDRYQLYYKDEPMIPARWPNDGFTYISDVQMLDPIDVRGSKGDKIGKIIFQDERLQRWSSEKDIWAHGYWFWDWQDQRHKIQTIDEKSKTIDFAKPYHVYGYRQGQWFYIYNALSELDQPGEYYLDRDKQILYFWPPEKNIGKASVAALATLMRFRGVSNIKFQGLTLEQSRCDGLVIDNSTNITFEDCIIRNIGGWAVRVAGGETCNIAGCKLYYIGEGGISLSGGDRSILKPAEHTAINNHIYDYARWDRTYRPGIQITGVGNKIIHNLIENAPHQGIFFSGNNHSIEYNEIRNVCKESNDAGAIYAGRDWSMRGNNIRFNYIHDIVGINNKGSVGIYLDDQFSGVTIFGNIFSRVNLAVYIGGGRDNSVENNIFIGCMPSIQVDARGVGWASSAYKILKSGLESVPFKSNIWKAQYPALPEILNDEPMLPKGNRISHNVSYLGKWLEADKIAGPYLILTDNLVGVDPHFIDITRPYLGFHDDSGAYGIGFKRLLKPWPGLMHSDMPVAPDFIPSTNSRNSQ